MKSLTLAFMLIAAWPSAPISRLVLCQNADAQAPTRYSLLTFTPYNPARVGFESLPVQITGAGGGKLGPREKFKILVSKLRNQTEKSVKAIRISYFIFKYGESDEVVPLETRQTPLIPLHLAAFEQRNVDILVVNVDDIPLLEYRSGQRFHMEVAVTEVQYSNGSIWQGTDLPQKLDPAKAPKVRPN